MGLLDEIRDGAVSAKTDIGEVLRKCVVLAFELGNEDLRSWAERELNGYGPQDELPTYRIVRAPSTGHLSGGWGSALKNAPLPLGDLPEDLQDLLSKLRFRGPVGTYAQMVKDGKDNGHLVAPWAPDLVAMLANRFYEDMNLLGAWQTFPVGALHAITETVRNRVLQFVLQIAKEAPAAKESVVAATDQLSKERLQNIFNTTIMGNVGNLATGSSDFTQQSLFSVVKGNLESLERYLSASGVPPDELKELKTALGDDPKPTEKGKFGPKVSGWIGKMVSRAASGAWDITANTAGGLLAQAIGTYLGV